MNHFGFFLLVRSKVSWSLNFLYFKAIDLLILFNFFTTIIFFVRNINILTTFYFYFNNLPRLSISFDANFRINLFKIELWLWRSFTWWKQINANIFCFRIKLLIKSLLIDWYSNLFLTTCIMLSRSVRRFWILLLFALSNFP